MIGTWYWKIPKVKVKSPLTPFPFHGAFAEHWNPGLKLAHGINFAGRDSKINTSRQTAFLPDTCEQLQVTSFLPTTLILILRKKLFCYCFVDKIIFYRHYCCYAGDCSPRLHVTLGHSGEPGESNGCSEVPSAYYNTNFKHNCLCCCCWNGAIFLCWEAFPLTVTVP